MSDIKYLYLTPFFALARKSTVSERERAENSSISRSALRAVMSGQGNLTLKSICSVSRSFNHSVELLVAPHRTDSEFSVVATAYKTERDGHDSWKIHFFDFVDHFRRTLDPKLILLAPPTTFDKKLKSLLCSIVNSLCRENEMNCPDWATRRSYLDVPWFVSEMESLKASVLLESPIEFRANNIFVNRNFLSRA